MSFSWSGAVAQLTELVLAILLAPLLLGWVNQCRAWLQNKRGPGVLRPYLALRKLFAKDAIIAHGASPLFRVVPYVLFGAMCMAAAIVPTLGTDLPYAPAADAIALVGILALARVALALAGMDIGTAFGSLGARREMMIGFLAEPALLMVLFTASLISQTTSLATTVETLSQRELAIYPSLAFAGVAFTMVSLAENARIPVDNPATHLELTMIHEAMILEYSGRHLALVEWAASLKLFVYSCIGIALFFPFGIARAGDPAALLLALPALVLKLGIGGFLLALIEMVSAKMRIFRAPEFLGTAFMLAVLALLLHAFLETS
jgi:formate hydrogenlyase subunit 4